MDARAVFGVSFGEHEDLEAAEDVAIDLVSELGGQAEEQRVTLVAERAAG